MAIHFTAERMARVLASHEKWWRGELDRPLAAITLRDAYAVPRTGKAPLLSQATCADFRYSAEELIDTLDAELSTMEFLGDAYPRVNLDAFGPGVLAAFCGAKLDNATGRVWFFPQKPMEIGGIHVEYNPDNVWVRRVKDICRAGIARWGNLVQIGMVDLGGVMDVAATFRGSENLLTDLYDAPDEVLRLCAEIETAWREAYRDIAGILHPATDGYTDWSGLLSQTPSYIVQCDFSYMISRGMFDRFVLPTIRRDTEWFARSIYHLDGIGEIRHLDALLALDALDAVQWVQGDGQPGPMHWLDIYRRILSAGKRVMLVGGAKECAEVMDVIGGRGMYVNIGISAQESAAVKPILDRIGGA